MVNILCIKCKAVYKSYPTLRFLIKHDYLNSNYDNCITSYACPECRKDWRRTRVSGVVWKQITDSELVKIRK